MNAEASCSIEKFREYVRIPTVQPEPDYEPAVNFLKEYADELGLEFAVVTPIPKKPVVRLSWIGTNPSDSSIMLVSHVDVVPVFPESWSWEPFGAQIDPATGNIYGRGTQDMKCVGIQYLEAIRRLKADGLVLKRTLHAVFVPDEEIGGVDGMAKFIETDEFRKLNVGFSLDEGLASPTEVYPVYYGERSQQWLEFIFTGNPGHGSRFIPDTAAEKMAKFMGYLMEFREEQKKILDSDPKLTDGDVTSTNITILKGGVQPNVVPAELRMTVDFRVSPSMGLSTFRSRLDGWMRDSGADVRCVPVCAFDSSSVTSTGSDNKFWTAFADTCSALGMKIRPQIFPAGTDSRYLRSIGIPAIGFSPMINTPVLLHDHDEFLNKDVFLKGIEIYRALLPAVANVETE